MSPNPTGGTTSPTTIRGIAALRAAIAALAQQVTGLSNSVAILASAQSQQAKSGDSGTGAAASKKGGSAGGGAAEGLEKALRAATSRVLLFLAPMVGFASLLNQASSGFSVFLAAMKVVAATIAPLLLPVFVLMAAAALAVSDEIWRGLLPHLREWYTYVVTNMMPALVKLVGAFMYAAERLAAIQSDPVKTLTNMAAQADADNKSGLPGRIRKWIGGKFGEWLSEQNGTGKDHDKWMARPDRSNQEIEETIRKRDAARARGEDPDKAAPLPVKPYNPAEYEKEQERIRAAKDGTPPSGATNGGWFGGIGTLVEKHGKKPPSVFDRVAAAVRDIIVTLRQQSGPPGQLFNDPSQLVKRAQEASANQDPLEKRIKERLLDSLDALEDVLSKIEGNTKQKPQGLFEGG